MKIFLIDITQYKMEQLSCLVSDERLKKSSRYHHEMDRRRSLAAGALLNYAVRQHFPQKEVPVTPALNRYGKPYLDFMEFSLSHSGRYAACAVGHQPIGVDIEHQRDFHPELARRFFTEKEASACTDSKSFTICWTLKESFLKATGYGMKLPMNSFEINPALFDAKRKDSFEYIHSLDDHRYFAKTYVIGNDTYLSVCSMDCCDFPETIITPCDDFLYAGGSFGV